MSLLEILAIAVALSMDAFAVAIASGILLCTVTKRQYFRLAFHFGLFQGGMPLLGYLAGLTVRDFIEAWDHWLAFALLVLVGGKMIYDALQPPEEENTSCPDPTKGTRLVVLSVATSIDALAVGFSVALLHQSIWLPAITISITCALFTFLGLYVGKVAANTVNLGHKATFVGGIVLVAIGIRILWEHGVFA